MTDFFPLSYPTYSTVIELPQEASEYETVETGEIKRKEKEKTIELDLDIENLDNKNIKELKNIARSLNIKGAGGMNKKNLIKFIGLKLKK